MKLGNLISINVALPTHMHRNAAGVRYKEGENHMIKISFQLLQDQDILHMIQNVSLDNMDIYKICFIVIIIPFSNYWI